MLETECGGFGQKTAEPSNEMVLSLHLPIDTSDAVLSNDYSQLYVISPQPKYNDTTYFYTLVSLEQVIPPQSHDGLLFEGTTKVLFSVYDSDAHHALKSLKRSLPEEHDISVNVGSATVTWTAEDGEEFVGSYTLTRGEKKGNEDCPIVFNEQTANCTSYLSHIYSEVDGVSGVVNQHFRTEDTLLDFAYIPRSTYAALVVAEGADADEVKAEVAEVVSNPWMTMMGDVTVKGPFVHNDSLILELDMSGSKIVPFVTE